MTRPTPEAAAERAAIGNDAPLAIASGVTPDNVSAFLPHVSHILVSTGVSASFHEFDPARLRALVVASAIERGDHLTGERT